VERTHITLRQGATIVERGNKLASFELLPVNQLGKRMGRTAVVFPGYQYAESPVSNQSQILKNSPLGELGANDLWNLETKFRTRSTDAGPDIPARKQKLILLSCGIFQHSPMAAAHSELRIESSAVSGPSPCIKCVP